MFAYSPADATVSQNAIISCFIGSYIQTGFTILLLALVHNEDFRAKKRHIHSSGRVYGRFLRTKALAQTTSGSFECRFSCEETVCSPHPTPQVFQTDIESRQTHSQCHRPCQLSEVTNAKLSSMKRMRFSSVGPMLDLLPLEIINYYTNYVLQQSTKSTASHTYRIIFHFMLHLLPFTASIRTL